MRSLATVRVRITVVAVLVVGVALAIGGIVLVSVHHAQLDRDVEAAARLRADNVASVLDQQQGTLDLDVATAEESLVQVVDDSGKVVTASPNLRGRGPISRLRPLVGETKVRSIARVPGREAHFRLVAESVGINGDRYTVYVAQSLEPADDSAQNLAGLLAAGLPLMLLFVGVTTWFVTGRALRPVESIRTEVEAIGAGDLHRRVPTPPTDDEIGRLARTMNAMLARLEAADQSQRRFVADASHELRTPLTSMRAQLEVDLAHPDQADWEATGRGVLEDTTNMQQLVGDLLALAELESTRSAVPCRAPVDLDDVVMTEVTRLRPATRVVVDASAVSGAQVEGDVAQLTRVVRNLLDNAVQYASSRVTVSLEEADGVACLTVSNDGSAIPPTEYDRIFERFARLDDARTEHTGGTGLGLAIVREIVERHDGVIEVLDGPGACFRVTLPVG